MSDIMRCPNCGSELDEDKYCFECHMFFDEDDLEDDFTDDYGNLDFSNDFEEDLTQDFDDVDYDSMVNNGDAICLNCTYWSVSPYGSAYGMVCRRGYMTDGPGDSCGDFMQETHFASYGDEGQYQFNETGRAISNKLYYWKNSR
ncbi:MAG: hypothetical protein IJF83_00245 [Methanobrevibacter sp.]|nr:hypothetical protein [Methanobrevibacter sp.]